jgi:hypothetical protein
MDDYQYLDGVVGRLVRIYSQLSESSVVEKPRWQSDRNQFRHATQNAPLLVLLKGVRTVSLLKAALILFRCGHAQEIGILVRCMDESLEDMMLFLQDPGSDPSIEKAQARALREFFQEEFEDPNAALLTSASRDRVPRDKVRAAIASLGAQAINPHDHGQILRTIHSTFSGYVHGAYPHIMELYGGAPARYHMTGMAGTPRMAEMLRQLVNQTYRGILGAQLTSGKLGQKQVLTVRKDMEARYPNVAPDPNVAIAKLKKQRN